MERKEREYVVTCTVCYMSFNLPMEIANAPVHFFLGVAEPCPGTGKPSVEYSASYLVRPLDIVDADQQANELAG